MPIRDVAAQNASLNNDYGSTAGANAPTSWQVALFVGDPMDGGTEMPDETELDDLSVVPNGYARVTIAQSAWAAAVDGEKRTAVPVQFANALAEWPETATHWALFDAADGTTMWDCALLDRELNVNAAGAGPSVALSVFYDNNLDD